MELLRIECSGCHSVLQVRGEMAGQQLRCPKCGGVVSIPQSKPAAPPAPSPAMSSTVLPAAPTTPSTVKPAAPPSSIKTSSAATPLGQATALDLMAEIRRRKKSAVLVVFETPTTGTYDLSQQPDANARCYHTDDMTDAQLMEVLEHLGRMSQGKRTQKGGIDLRPDAGAMAFELKGDRLGMTLEEFKTKYARKIGGMTMPYCSDAAPGQSNPTLWSEPWHLAAGLVSGRVDLPSENNSPTVAGVKTELLLYHFVDGRLFRITALFDTEAFHLIRDALLAKHGAPTSEVKEPTELTWRNDVSTIRLARGTVRPKKASMLQLIHHELLKSAEGRAPKRSDDL